MPFHVICTQFSFLGSRNSQSPTNAIAHDVALYETNLLIWLRRKRIVVAVLNSIFLKILFPSYPLVFGRRTFSLQVSLSLTYFCIIGFSETSHSDGKIHQKNVTCVYYVHQKNVTYVHYALQMMVTRRLLPGQYLHVCSGISGSLDWLFCHLQGPTDRIILFFLINVFIFKTFYPACPFMANQKFNK